MVTKAVDKSKSSHIQNDRNIGTQVYEAVMLFLEIIFLLLKMCYVYLEAIFRLFVSRPMKDVEGEIVLITGSGHGIGKELSLQFAALRAIVVCVDVNEVGNVKTVEEIKRMGGKAFSFTCDISNKKNVDELCEKVRKQVGEVSILVNNAGIMPCHSFLTHKEEEIVKMFEVNVFSHFWLLQQLLPSMIERNHGHIVTISSLAGMVGASYLVPYSSSKFAVTGYMEALHEELREDKRNLNIKMTCVLPYTVNTGLAKNPKTRFPNILGVLNPKEVASITIEEMRRNHTIVTIPKILLTIHRICNAQPRWIKLLLKDFLDSGVNPHS